MAREYLRPLSEYQQIEAGLLTKARLIASGKVPTPPAHDCFEHSVYVEFDGALGQAYYCGLCGDLLQVG